MTGYAFSLHCYDVSELSIQTIGTRISAWGEGPVWWKNHLLYVDIEGHALIQLNPRNGEERIWEVGERIGTVVPTKDGHFLYAGDTGFVYLNAKTGEKTALADPEVNLRKVNRFNDGKCDPAGRFWAGTISLVKDSGTAALYMLDEKCTLHLKITGVTNSNGICWSVDTKSMYYIDTPLKQVRRYHFDLKSGAISHPEIVINTLAQGFNNSPDGMTIDAEDKLWIAFCHGGCIARFDPKTGKKLRQINLPCMETTACAFGGENLDRLFVTTGTHKNIEEKDAGKVFAIDGLNVCGIPAFAYNQTVPVFPPA